MYRTKIYTFTILTRGDLMASKIFKGILRAAVVLIALFGIYHVYISRKLDQEDFNG